MKFKNRITKLLGVELPIVQAPMGWIARSKLASAVSNAGGMGIIETSSGQLDEIKEEIKKMIIMQNSFFCSPSPPIQLIENLFLKNVLDIYIAIFNNEVVAFSSLTKDN